MNSLGYTVLAKNYTFKLAIVFLALLLGSSSTLANRVDNPFLNATGYIDPDYVRQVESSIKLVERSMAYQMSIVAKQPTAIWMDSIAAINGYSGKRQTLEQHLINAESQRQISGGELTVLVVLYSLPNRDCAARASNGTMHGKVGMQQYRDEFVDPIATLFRDSRFSNLRIIALVEPDSLPNLITNLGVSDCKEAFEKRIYADGIAYVINQFATISNVYTYLDFGHSGWLGWDNNRARAIELYADVVGSAGALEYINGVVTNVSGYSPTEEPLLPDPSYDIEGRSVKSAKFYEYNSQFDERDFATVLHEDFMAAGFPPNFGVLIDTSRNGWGGQLKPDTAVWNSSVNAYVDAARLDQRHARGHWCNQSGAGLGELPRSNPYGDGIVHSFVWIKPPGESDGSSNSSQTVPDEQGKSFDPNCDPDGTTDAGLPTGALGDAPAAGEWFHEQFKMLIENANPPIQY